MTRISRRQFVKVTSAGVLASACGGDGANPEDTLEAGPEPSPETSVAVDTTPPPDTTPATELPPEDTTPDLVEADTGPAAIGTFDPTAVPEGPREVFLYGVQAGDPTTDGAVLWTRFSPPEVDPTPEEADAVETVEAAEAGDTNDAPDSMDAGEDGAGSDAADGEEMGPDPTEPILEVLVFAHGAFDEGGDLYVRERCDIAEGGFVHVQVSGLASDRRYRYAFVTSDEAGEPLERSPVGSFLTAPDPDALRPVIFGGTSCVNHDYAPYRVLNRAAEYELDFFLLGGDTAYCDGAKTLEDYREKWGQAFDSDGYRALLSSTGTYASWDDHEVDDNWNPEVVDPFKLQFAKRSMLDHIALRLQTDGDPIEDWRIWRSYRWGRTLELFILDCRAERLPSTAKLSTAQYITKAQMDWLKVGLRQSPCTFKIIANSVPITNMPDWYPSEKDRWEGYEPQRLEILSLIDGPPILPGVLWLSGDFHFGCVTRLEPEGQRFSNQWEVFMGQGANIPNPAWVPLAEEVGDGQFAFVTDRNNFVRFICDPISTPPRISAQFIDENGTVLHRHEFEFPTP